MIRRIPRLSIFLFVLDLVIVPVGLYGASVLRSLIPLGVSGALPEAAVSAPWYVYALAMLCWAVGQSTAGSYDPGRVLRWFNEAWRVIWGSALATVLMAGLLYMSYRELSRLQFVYFLALTLLITLGYRAGLRMYYRVAGRDRPGGSRIIIVGAGDLGEKLGKLLRDHSRWGYQPMGYLDDAPELHGKRVSELPVLGSVGELRSAVEEQRIDQVWVALPLSAHERLQDVLLALERQPVQVKVIPDYFSLALVRASADILGGMPVIGLRDPLIEGMPRILKRAFDLSISLLLLPPTALIYAILAVLIRLDSKGPIVLRQERVGENGRPFEMLKLRTMAYAPGEEVPRSREGDPEHKRPDDPRVTRVGRILRRWSLDELPQLWNVIKGDMSLVGPRPELPWLVDRYEPWQRKRFAVPQGITGWWQINGRSDKPMHLNTGDDLYYVYNYSLWLDIQILLRTPLAVVQGKGAF